MFTPNKFNQQNHVFVRRIVSSMYAYLEALKNISTMVLCPEDGTADIE